MEDCNCNAPQYANHGTTCLHCEKEAELKARDEEADREEWWAQGRAQPSREILGTEVPTDFFEYLNKMVADAAKRTLNQ